MDVQERNDLIVKLYTQQFLSCNRIAKMVGISRVAVCKILNKKGITTKKQKVKVKCSYCGKEFYRARCYLRQRQNTFCSRECYIAFVKAKTNYISNRYGQMVAREVVQNRYRFLKDMQGWVVHHRDGNDKNNALQNLVVFRSQEAHMRFHRGGHVGEDEILAGKL